LYVFSLLGLYFPYPRTLLQYLTTYAGPHRLVDFSGSRLIASTDPEPLVLESAHYDRLKKEADGLLPGVTLLNEMEPLEDIDEPGLGHSHDYMDLETAQTVEDFLNRLRPTSCGEGIGCSWDPFDGRFACESSFSCTIPAIQAHFQDCTLLQDFTVKEPLYEALKVFLGRPESKTRIANLRQQCRIIQAGLRSLPDIDNFLSQLIYLPSGNVKCGQQACADLDEFLPVSHLVRNHFHLYHCSNFKGALRRDTHDEICRAVDAQLQRPETASMIAKFQSTITEGTETLAPATLKVYLESENSNKEYYFQVPKPNWEQLRVLRTLRAKFIVHHRYFLQRTASSCSDELRELRRSCRRYADLLGTGLFTFKAIMNNESPLSLKETFAFISLSYAMVGTMQARGKPIKFCLDELEMQRWRSNLLTRRDRDTFEELVSLLWPELNKYQEGNPWDLDQSWDMLIFSIFGSVHRNMERRSPLRSTAERLLQESSSDENFRFGDWLNFSNTDTSSFQPGEFDLVRSLHDTLWTRSPEIQQPSDLHSRHGKISGRFKIQHTDTGEDGSTLEQLQGLAQTVIFIQAISFLICEIF
jgi:hypothetical protein